MLALVVSVASFWESHRAGEIASEKAAPLIYTTEAAQRRPLAANREAQLAVTLMNFGEIPTENISTTYNMQLVPAGDQLVADLANGTEDSYSEPVLASHDWTRINYRSRSPLTKQQYADVAKGHLVLFFYGKTDYKAGSKPKSLRWCWKYNSDLREFWRCDPEDLKTP